MLARVGWVGDAREHGLGVEHRLLLHDGGEGAVLGRGVGRQRVRRLLPPGEAGHEEVLLALAGARARAAVLQDHPLRVQHRGRRHGQQRHLAARHARPNARPLGDAPLGLGVVTALLHKCSVASVSFRKTATRQQQSAARRGLGLASGHPTVVSVSEGCHTVTCRVTCHVSHWARITPTHKTSATNSFLPSSPRGDLDAGLLLLRLHSEKVVGIILIISLSRLNVWAAVDRGRGEPVINSLLLYNTLHNLTRHHLIQFEITRIILSRERGTDLHFHNLSVPDKMKCRVIAPVFTRDGVRLRRGGHSPEKILAPIRRRPLLSSLCAPSKCDPMTGKYFTREKYLDVLEKISHL